MIVLLAFGITLLLAVLLSELARRTVFSLSVLFLAAGFVIGPGVLAFVDIRAAEPLVEQFIELALFDRYPGRPVVRGKATASALPLC